MKDRVGTEIKVGDFLLYCVNGDRNPKISFGWVEEIQDNREQVTRPSDGYTYTTGDVKLKIHRSTHGGRRLNKTVTEYGEYDPNTRTYPDKYVRDTGKPDTTRLSSYGESDDRYLVISPL